MKTTGELIHTSLVMYRNWLETKDVLMSATDAVNCNQLGKIRALDPHQKKTVCKLEALIDKKLHEITKDEL